MNTINFPTNNFFKDKKYLPEKFSYEAMVLICLNKYFSTLLLSQALGNNYNLEKSFDYFLDDFEINFLGKISDEKKEKYFETNFHKILYNFNLSNSRKRYKGIIEINTEFVDKDSLEKSYYKVDIELFPENDLDILTNTSREEEILLIAKEFLNKIWSEIFKNLKHYEMSHFNLTKEAIEDLSYFTSPILPDLSVTKEITDLISDESFIFDDSVVDVYHILFNLFINNQNESDSIYIKADDILLVRNKKKNINSIGNRGGYKEKSKLKIHKNLMFLCAVNIISMQELEKYYYCITFNKQIFSKENLTYPISKKILEYNPKTQVWNKRIGEYLCFSLYISKVNKCTIPVAKVISIMEDKTQSLKPSQIRDNLEKTFDSLISDNIISCWQYKYIDEENLTGKNWLNTYKNYKIIAEL